MVATFPPAASVLAFAPAKLNIFLELHGRREDGFHELETVMVAIDWFDRLRLTGRQDGQIMLNCRWAPSAGVRLQRLGKNEASAGDLLAIPTGSDNLVYRALAAFAEVFQRDSGPRSAAPGFSVELEKRIPAGAGMGGASSDAAAALRAAAALWSISPRDARLWDVAASIGSDVPFFLGTRPAEGDAAATAPGGDPVGLQRAMLATGRGEKLSHLPMSGDLHFVVCYPPQALSTAEVYRNCTLPDRPVAVQSLAASLTQATSHAVGKRLWNRLSEPAVKLSAHVDRVLQAMRQAGLLYTQMTGSGSACFGLAASDRCARRAAQLLSSRRLGVTTVARPTAVPARIVQSPGNGGEVAARRRNETIGD